MCVCVCMFSIINRLFVFVSGKNIWIVLAHVRNENKKRTSPNAVVEYRQRAVVCLVFNRLYKREIVILITVVFNETGILFLMGINF